MKSNYKQLGDLVQWVDERNKTYESTDVLGVSIEKRFMPSVANTIGTDLSSYKLVRKGRFACNPMHVGRDKALPVALYSGSKSAIVSPAYFVFEVLDASEVLPEYLILLFQTSLFDRNCWFRTDGTVRGGISWADLCLVGLPVPNIEVQRGIVSQYNVIEKRIAVLRNSSALVEDAAASYFNSLLQKEGRLCELADYVNFNPIRPIAKETVASCYEMATLPTEGSFLNRGEKKLYNGGMRFQNGDTLIARITPCLENGKAAYVDRLNDGEVAFGSTEVIVMEPKPGVSSSLAYFVVRHPEFRAFAAEFMNGSSGRQRVTATQLQAFKMPSASSGSLAKFSRMGESALRYMGQMAREVENLREFQSFIISNISRKYHEIR